MKLLIGNQIDPATSVAALPDGTPYVASPWRLAFFQDANGDWLEDHAWPGRYDATIFCRTPGCEVDGDHFQIRVRENVDGVFRVGCGLCGQAITEIWVADDMEPLPLFPPDTATLGPRLDAEDPFQLPQTLGHQPGAGGLFHALPHPARSREQR